MVRLIIAGGRDFADAELLYRKCDALAPSSIEYVLCGMAAGADKLGRKWAINRGHMVKEFPADWNRFNKAAGPIRNSAMALDAAGGLNGGTLIAFWNGKSRGTRDMIFKALDCGLEVYVVRYN